MDIRRVVQVDSTGCGIACVAMITGKFYKDIKQVGLENDIFSTKKALYTDTADIVKMLKILGIPTEKGRKVSNWDTIKSISIVGINYRESSDTWHWEVYIPNEEEGYVLDPNKKIKNDKRTDFSRMKLRSYIPVNFL